MSDNKITKTIVAISPFIVLLMYKISDILGIETVCVFKLITGKDCFGCNITHSIVACLRGDFALAFQLNPLVFLVLPILIFVWLKYIYKNFCI